MAVFDLDSFACPRCGVTTSSDFYGPCQDCRAQLVAAFARSGRAVVAGEYEPKMNVTPNAVATKD